MSGWRLQRPVAAGSIRDARVPLHRIVQLLAAVGAAAVPAAPDDSHTSLRVDPKGDGLWLTGSWSDGTPRERAVMALPGMELLVQGADESVTGRLALGGESLSSALAWLEARFARSLALPDYDLPAHAIGDGAPIEAPAAEPMEEIVSGFANAAVLLADHVPDGASVRCWPHHFDVAFLEPRGGDRSVGVGWSPGDDSYESPYWYVAPWPHPPAASLARLELGRWHTEGFVAAVLEHGDVAQASSATAQERTVRTFLHEATLAARAALSENEHE